MYLWRTLYSVNWKYTIYQKFLLLSFFASCMCGKNETSEKFSLVDNKSTAVEVLKIYQWFNIYHPG